MIVGEPIELAHHGTEGGDDERRPFVVVHTVLWGGSGRVRMEEVRGVVSTEEIVDYGHGFPGHHAGISILCSRSIFVSEIGDRAASGTYRVLAPCR